MAGIYIHIPFCKTKCTYCDFYKTTDTSEKNELLEAMIQEILLRKTYLTEVVETIYFGGGTPSTLSVNEIKRLLSTIFSNFEISENIEITLEANPDDIDLDYLKELRSIGINRLSMGIQSFDNEQLKFVNRRHTAEEAIAAVENSIEAGFENISIDLIYGLPLQSFDSWKKQIDRALQLNVQHISSYGLTYEEGTALWRQMKSGKVVPTDDETMIAMYEYLVESCENAGFKQYEISNFAKNGLISKHNSSYWKERAYLGIGPSAHSYNLHSRQWNVSSIPLYNKAITNNEVFFEKEELTKNEQYNDYIMISLRTIEGINLEEIKNKFGEDFFNHLMKSANPFIDDKKLLSVDNRLSLSKNGILISDNIIMNLMIV